MYQKYQTDALVLGSREIAEADKMISLYTRDFGLVRARAGAVRSEKSKMRYAMQNYSLAHVSLIRGKRGWRVAGARSVGQGLSLSAFARISELTQRLVAGQEKNEYLYDTLSGAHEALMRGGNPETIEVLCVARVLYSLGYLSSEILQTVLFTHADYDPSDLEEAEKLRETLIASINRALSETQL